MWERVRSIIIKEFRETFRDKRMLIIIFIAPLFQLFVFGYAATTDVNHIPAAVYDLDNTRQSRDVTREFSYSEYFDIKYYVYNDAEEEKLIDKSRVDVVFRFQRGFARDIEAGRSAALQMVVDGTDSNTASVILSYASQILERYQAAALGERVRIALKTVNAVPGVDLRARAWFNENLESRYFFIPGVIALIITIMSLLLTAMAIVREKEIGTMEQLIVSPLKPYELIMGKLIPFALIALAELVIVTVIGVGWFRLPFRGDIIFLFICVIIFLLTSSGVGLLISTISSTQQEAMMSTFLFFFPAILLSGFMFPIDNMPRIVQYITYINPLRYLMIILRGIFLKGIGIGILWPQLCALLVIGAGVLVFSSLKFRRQLN